MLHKKELLKMLFSPEEIMILIKNFPIHLRAFSKKLFPSRDFYKIIFSEKSFFIAFLMK